MSNAVSALDGQVAPGEVTVRELGLRGMITLRGDLSSRKLQTICKKLTGVAFPKQSGVASEGDKGLAWMSPDEVLVMVPHAEALEAVAAIEAALKGEHFLAVNVSDARAVFSVQGAFSREVIAKLAPADLHPDRFQEGMMRRTRLGQVAAAFWMVDEETFNVICFRSVAEYTFGLLKASAGAGEVGFFG